MEEMLRGKCVGRGFYILLRHTTPSCCFHTFSSPEALQLLSFGVFVKALGCKAMAN